MHCCFLQHFKNCSLVIVILFAWSCLNLSLNNRAGKKASSYCSDLIWLQSAVCIIKDWSAMASRRTNSNKRSKGRSKKRKPVQMFGRFKCPECSKYWTSPWTWIKTSLRGNEYVSTPIFCSNVLFKSCIFIYLFITVFLLISLLPFVLYTYTDVGPKWAFEIHIAN